MKVGWEINRFQEFHKKQVNNYLSQVEFLMSRSGSKDPGHCASKKGRPNAPHHPSSAENSQKELDAPIRKELGLPSLEGGMLGS